MKLLTPKERVDHLCRRQWWWSPAPFWQYVNGAGQGWGNFIEIHPGSFNLAWLAAGGPKPLVDYTPHAREIRWVLTEAHHIPVGHKTLADWAFEQGLPAFYQTCLSDRLLQVWEFIEPSMSYNKLLGMLQWQMAVGK